MDKQTNLLKRIAHHLGWHDWKGNFEEDISPATSFVIALDPTRYYELSNIPGEYYYHVLLNERCRICGRKHEWPSIVETRLTRNIAGLSEAVRAAKAKRAKSDSSISAQGHLILHNISLEQWQAALAMFAVLSETKWEHVIPHECENLEQKASHQP